MSRPSAPQRQRDPRSPDQPAGPASQPAGLGARWRGFVARYGWRAYALPPLALVTVLAVTTNGGRNLGHTVSAASPAGTVNSPAAVSQPPATLTPSSPPTAAATGQLKSDSPAAGSITKALPPLALPPGPKYTTTGKATFATVPGTSGVVGKGRLYRYSIEVENGVTGVDLNAFAAVVTSSLGDSRSWAANGDAALQRVQSGPVDFSVSLVSSMTVRRLCGYSLPVETSCYDGGDSRVVLNVARWVRGAKVYSSDLASYRIYAVNHEVGHALGHNHSHNCLKNGLAPVMMQQTIGTKTATGQICAANPWPYPAGVGDAPGAEQPGSAADSEFFQRNST